MDIAGVVVAGNVADESVEDDGFDGGKDSSVEGCKVNDDGLLKEEEEEEVAGNETDDAAD